MQKRVVLLSAAVAVLGLAAAALGFVASKKSKGVVSFESFDEQHCVYRRNPGLGCGVAAALLARMAVNLATAASADGRATGRRFVVADKRLQAAWVAVLMATVMFLYGAAMKRGLSSSRPGWRYSRASYYGCTELRSGIFFMASIVSAIATGCAIAAYVSFQRTDEPEPGVEMGPTQWAQPYPPPPYGYPPPMAYPAPPQYGHGGYGSREPAGTA